MSDTVFDALPPTQSLFPSTHWSAVALAADAGPAAADAAREALGRLLTRYMPALRAHLLVTRRLDAHAADDLLQGFVAERVLDRGLLAKADPARGRFRAFLVTCLNRHVYDAFRHEHAARRRAPGGKPSPLDLLDDEESPAEKQLHDVFDLAWARQVVSDALERMRAACERSRRPDLWALFQGRVVAPAMEGAEPVGYDELTRTFGFPTVAHATNALVTAKRAYARLLREVVAEYVPAEEVDEELARLKQILAGGGSRSR